ncbi:MAG: biotin--[acetyl-CoA-carboxylase] ligase [Bacteroidales bacterium]|jgi:BirA family biotin operon repressor/biotin-[acetyl-CoA-carboxylase] ligase
MQQPVKYFHKRLNSTNLYANKLLVKQQVRQPFWIRTDDQFAGKGQGNHTWISEKEKNLTGTLVVFPNQIEASRQFELSKCFALAAVSFLDLFIDEVYIKWPNDLYAGDKKIGGILIETAILGKYLDHAIFGLGLNINQMIFSNELPNPVSIRLLTGIDYRLPEMETLFLESFVNQYRLIESEDFEVLDDEYVNRLYLINEFARYRASDKIFHAKILGVTENGHLIVQTDAGAVQTFSYGEVEYIL